MKKFLAAFLVLTMVLALVRGLRQQRRDPR